MVGDDDAATADLDGPLGVGGRHDALEAELTVPVSHHLGDIVPVHRRIEHLREVTADREAATADVDVPVELGKPESLVRGVVDPPHRLYRELQHPSERQPEGYGKAGAQIALAVPAGDAVHG